MSVKNNFRRAVDETGMSMVFVSVGFMAFFAATTLAIDVDTVDGVVSLKGQVDNKAQADKAVAVAKKIDGVKKVDATGLTVKKSGY